MLLLAEPRKWQWFYLNKTAKTVRSVWNIIELVLTAVFKCSLYEDLWKISFETMFKIFP